MNRWLLALQQKQVLLLVTERTGEESGKSPQTFLMLLQLEELEFKALSAATGTLNRLSLLHLCSSIVS